MASSTKTRDTSGTDTDQGIGDVARRLVEVAADGSAETGKTVLSVAGLAGETIRDADRTLRASSDQTLGFVAGLSLGAALGLLVGGASRLLVVTALVPAALVAGAAAERVRVGIPGPRARSGARSVRKAD